MAAIKNISRTPLRDMASDFFQKNKKLTVASPKAAMWVKGFRPVNFCPKFVYTILNNHLLRRWVGIHRAKPSLRLRWWCKTNRNSEFRSSFFVFSFPTFVYMIITFENYIINASYIQYFLYHKKRHSHQDITTAKGGGFLRRNKRNPSL